MWSSGGYRALHEDLQPLAPGQSLPKELDSIAQAAVIVDFINASSKLIIFAPKILTPRKISKGDHLSMIL